MTTKADKNKAVPMPPHGGDLTWAEQTFGICRDNWLDLSTGLNPWPYVPDASPSSQWAHLPTKDEESALERAARCFYGIPDDAGLIAAPGTQALIQWLPRIVPPSGVAIVAPTYGEHATAWYRSGHEVMEVVSLDLVPAAAEVVIVVNPNNPDGKMQSKGELLAMAGYLAERGGMLLVDEAFGDLVTENSLASNAGRPGLVILKSFGKFFGLAGLRLGFALGPVSMEKALRECLGPWAVSAPALDIGRQALLDGDWADQTRIKLKAAAASLDRILANAGLSIMGGTDLYRLIETPNARTLFAHLGRHGILTRCFSYNENWLRIGLPGSPADEKRLVDCLGQYHEQSTE